MHNILERLAYTTKRAKPYWRWILAGILFLLALLAGFVLWRRLDTIRRLENELALSKERLKHRSIKEQLTKNDEERAKLNREIAMLENRIEHLDGRIVSEKKIAEGVKESIDKAKAWKDLEEG